LRQVRLLGGTTNLFDYDANGLRMRKNDSTGTTGYLLDGLSVLEELNTAGSIVTSHFTGPHAIDEIKSFQQAGATFYPLSDALGSIYAVTNSSGTVVTTWTYDVYGATRQTFGTLALSFGFTATEHDPDSSVSAIPPAVLQPISRELLVDRSSWTSWRTKPVRIR